MMAVDMAQVPSRLNDVPDTALQLLGLGEAPIGLAVPEDFGREGRGTALGLVEDGDDEGAASRRLQGDFAERGGKG